MLTRFSIVSLEANDVGTHGLLNEVGYSSMVPKFPLITRLVFTELSILERKYILYPKNTPILSIITWL